MLILLFSPQDLDDDLDTGLEEPQNEYEGNKDAARALLRVKQKLDGYEDGEMRSIHGQVFLRYIPCQISIDYAYFFSFFIYIIIWLIKWVGYYRCYVSADIKYNFTCSNISWKI